MPVIVKSFSIIREVQAFIKFYFYLVRSYGTEDRPTDRPVAPRDETYEYIIFRGADIKDIRVCQPPKPQPTLEGGLPNDPAIVQHSGGPPLFAGAPGQTGAPGAAPFSSSNKSPAAPGANNYGPIGSSAPSGGQAFSAAPGSGVNNQSRLYTGIDLYC